MEEFEQEDGISLIDIFKVMFGRKLLLLIITAIVGIIGTIGILFIYNNSKQNYTTSFSFSDVNLVEGKYVDGAAFNYDSIVTKDNLLRVKDSDPEFESINVDKIIEDNGISVVFNSDETASYKYTLTTKKKYYSGTNQAKKYIDALISSVTKTNSQKVEYLSYDTNLSLYDKSSTLDLKVLYLKKQYEFLTNQYKDLTTKYGNYVVSSEKKSITVYEQEFKSAFYLTEYSTDLLYSNLINNVYSLNYAQNEKYFELQYNNYVSLYEANEKKIEELKQTISTIVGSATVKNQESIDLSEYNKALVEAINENTSYEDMIKYYGNLLGKIEPADPDYKEKATDAESQEYLNKLNAAKNELAKYTNILKKVNIEVLTDNNNIYYQNTNIIIVSGGIKTVIAVVLSVALGFVVGCVVNLVLDHKNLGKKEEVKEVEKTTE